ncbi:MAG: large subunit ribosomal protein L18 [Planctomycetota bacterium]|jgi:large subunit ribosomal protein L18
MALSKIQRKERIKRSIRKKISGSSTTPRLSVFRSNKSIYVQLIDDLNANTIAAIDSNNSAVKGATKMDQSKEVGALIASKAKDLGIENIVFDRNGYRYHGRIKALAEGARENGLKF